MTAASHPHLLWINHFAVTPADGGGTRHFELARELTRRGWRVSIAASDFHLHSRGYTRRRDATDRRAITEHLDGVELLWLWAAAYTRNDWRRGYNWLSFARSLARWRPASGRPDVVIGSSPHLFAALAGARLARRLGVPFLLEVRDLWPESLVAAGGRRGPAYYALDTIARHLYRRAERIIVLARGVGDYLARRGVPPHKLVYVPNSAGVTTGVGATCIERDGGAGEEADAHSTSRARGAAGSVASLTVVYAGAHGPANGLDTVLGAAALLKDEPIIFLLVGDGPAKPELQARAARLRLSNVEFRDPVPKTDIPALLAATDVGLMVLRDAPLFSYGVSPNKLFDYLAAGLPVVCNVPGEVASLLRDAGAGEQAADATPQALAEAILRMARRAPHERARMGRAGRAWVAREHARPVLAARLDRALREVIGA